MGFTHTVPANPETGCAPHAGTDKIGEAWGCSLAVNAGPFDMSKGGGCMGSLIANGTVYQIDDESGFASWGMTADGRYVFGDVNSSTVDEEGVVELVSGFIGPLLVQVLPIFRIYAESRIYHSNPTIRYPSSRATKMHFLLISLSIYIYSLTPISRWTMLRMALQFIRAAL